VIVERKGQLVDAKKNRIPFLGKDRGFDTSSCDTAVHDGGNGRPILTIYSQLVTRAENKDGRVLETAAYHGRPNT
jgi:hypothetical protein